jgi:hypothetical protein
LRHLASQASLVLRNAALTALEAIGLHDVVRERCPGERMFSYVEPELSDDYALASDPLNSHERPFAGMLYRHPRSASGRGGCSVSFFSLGGEHLASGKTCMVTRAIAGWL